MYQTQISESERSTSFYYVSPGHIILYIQSDLTYPHSYVLDEIVDKVRELNK